MTRKLSIKINRNELLYFFILIIFFKPADYVIGATLASLFSLYSVVIVFVVLLYCIMAGKKLGYRIGLSIFILDLFLFWCILGSTVINSIQGNVVNFSSAFVVFAQAFLLVMITDVGLHVAQKEYLGTFTFIGSIMCSIHAITMLVYGGRGGMNGLFGHNRYLLSADNASFFWVWPTLVVVWLYYFRYSRKSKMLMWAITYTFLVTVAYIYTWSVMAMLGCIGFIVLLFMFRKSDRQEYDIKTRTRGMEFRNPSTQFTLYWIVGMTFDYLMTFQLIFYRFATIITSFLRKSITMSGRERIWTRSIRYIYEKVWIGYGYEPTMISQQRIGINHTHNFLLEVLYRGGIIGLILLIIFLIYIGRKLKKVSANRVLNFALLIILLFFILTSVEFAFYRYPHWVLFVIIVHAEILVPENVLQLRDA